MKKSRKVELRGDFIKDNILRIKLRNYTIPDNPKGVVVEQEEKYKNFKYYNLEKDEFFNVDPTLTLKVIDKESFPLEKVNVTLEDNTLVTDEKGECIFDLRNAGVFDCKLKYNENDIIFENTCEIEVLEDKVEKVIKIDTDKNSIKVK